MGSQPLNWCTCGRRKLQSYPLCEECHNKKMSDFPAGYNPLQELDSLTKHIPTTDMRTPEVIQKYSLLWLWLSRTKDL